MDARTIDVAAAACRELEVMQAFFNAASSAAFAGDPIELSESGWLSLAERLRDIRRAVAPLLESARPGADEG